MTLNIGQKCGFAGSGDAEAGLMLCQVWELESWVWVIARADSGGFGMGIWVWCHIIGELEVNYDEYYYVITMCIVCVSRYSVGDMHARSVMA